MRTELWILYQLSCACASYETLSSPNGDTSARLLESSASNAGTKNPKSGHHFLKSLVCLRSKQDMHGNDDALGLLPSCICKPAIASKDNDELPLSPGNTRDCTCDNGEGTRVYENASPCVKNSGGKKVNRRALKPSIKPSAPLLDDFPGTDGETIGRHTHVSGFTEGEKVARLYKSASFYNLNKKEEKAHTDTNDTSLSMGKTSNDENERGVDACKDCAPLDAEQNSGDQEEEKYHVDKHSYKQEGRMQKGEEYCPLLGEEDVSSEEEACVGGLLNKARDDKQERKIRGSEADNHSVPDETGNDQQEREVSTNEDSLPLLDKYEREDEMCERGGYFPLVEEHTSSDDELLGNKACSFLSSEGSSTDQKEKEECTRTYVDQLYTSSDGTTLMEERRREDANFLFAITFCSICAVVIGIWAYNCCL